MNARTADFWTHFTLFCVLQGSHFKCVSCSSSHQGHIQLLTWLMYLWVDSDSLCCHQKVMDRDHLKQAVTQWPSSSFPLKKTQSPRLTLTLVPENKKSETQRDLCSIRRKILISMNNFYCHAMQSLRGNRCLEFRMSRQADDWFPLEVEEPEPGGADMGSNLIKTLNRQCYCQLPGGREKNKSVSEFCCLIFLF